MRTIKVQGKGTVSREPDLVILSFDIETSSTGYASAMDMLNSQTNELRTNLKSGGVNRLELKTSDFSIREKKLYNKAGSCIFNGYSASHSLRLELPMEKEKLNLTLWLVSQGHSGARLSIDFSVKDKAAMKRDALKEAVLVAKQNAMTLAEASEIKLGALQQIDYGWAEVHFYEQRISHGCCSDQAEDAGPDITPEEVSATDNVTLVYEIL